MNIYRRALGISLLLLGIGLVSAVHHEKKQDPPGTFSSGRLFDTSGIVIDANIKDSFSCVYRLLQEVISNKRGLFRASALKLFFECPNIRLVFSERELPDSLGGESYRADFNGIFVDTIFLNTRYFKRASREYMIGVIIHETVHAFITFCALSYVNHQQNKVDLTFLKRHFRHHWKWLTIAPDPGAHIITKPDDDQQHEIMCDDLFTLMDNSLYLYTDPDLSADFRDLIAQSLTWGGLTRTSGWKNKSHIDSCYNRAVDIWSRNINAPKNTKADDPNCRTTYHSFLDTLKLKPLCQ